MQRLSGGARKSGRAAALVAAAMLQPGERVETVVAGRWLAHDAIVVLTDRRLLVANDRSWSPEVLVVDQVGGLEVAGWAERRAVLQISGSGQEVVIDQIVDVSMAEAMAGAIRAR